MNQPDPVSQNADLKTVLDISKLRKTRHSFTSISMILMSVIIRDYT